jgi:hypothetical protein
VAFAAGTTTIDGTPNTVEGIKLVEYGGVNTSDSSGVVRHLRVWNAGHITRRNEEINGLTLAGVGSNTLVEHVEVA